VAKMQTYSGFAIDPYNPDPAKINIADIAHHLSMICRYTGAVRQFYSVAQHCVMVSKVCAAADAQAGLLHDAEEYLFNDLSRPVKYPLFHDDSRPVEDGMETYRGAAFRLREIIFKLFKLPSAVLPMSVIQADINMLYTERRDLMLNLIDPKHEPEWRMGLQGEAYQSFAIVPLDPPAAELLFLRRFRELFPNEVI
jgi:uncharacterized protein